MKQVLLGNAKAVLSTSAIRYASLMGGYTWESSNIYARQIVGTPGTVRNLRVNLSVAPGVGKSRTFTLLKNNVETALTVTISDAATQGSDTAHDVSVSAGDRLAIKAVPINTPAAVCYADCTTEFEGDVTDESLILGTGRTYLLSVSDAEYAFCAGAYTWNGTVSNREEIVSTSGTIKKLYVYVNVAPGVGKSLTFTLMKNGVATSLEVTISGTDKSGSDTVNTVSVSVFDRISLRCTPANTPNTGYTCWGMVFLADISGESLVLGGSDYDLKNTSIRYNVLMGSAFWGAEAYVRELLQGVSGYTVTLKNLHVWLSGSPGAAEWATPSSVHSKCGEHESYPATNAIDGDTGTSWLHNLVCYHWIIMDMGATKKITKIRLYQGAPLYRWGGSDGLKVYVSDDPANFGDPVWEGVLDAAGWQESGSFEKNGRYVKLESKSDAAIQMMYEFDAYLRKSYKFTVMKNGVATSLEVTISGAAQGASDTVNQVTVSDFDEFTLRCIPTNTPTVRDAFWGATILVEAVAPPAVKAGLNIPQVLQIILGQ